MNEYYICQCLISLLGTSGEYVYGARLAIRVTYQICPRISRLSLLMRGSLIFTSAAYAMQELLVIINTNCQISKVMFPNGFFTVYYEIRHLTNVILIHSSEEEEKEDPQKIFNFGTIADSIWCIIISIFFGFFLLIFLFFFFFIFCFLG